MVYPRTLKAEEKDIFTGTSGGHLLPVEFVRPEIESERNVAGNIENAEFSNTAQPFQLPSDAFEPFDRIEVLVLT
jgi:hypothetical protein